MPLEQAILISGSRLMRDLLKRVIEKFTNIEVFKEISDIDELPSIINSIEAKWLFIVLSPDDAFPEEPIRELLLLHPKLRVVSFWTDGSHVKTEWLGHQARDFVGITLDQLASLLQKELWSNNSTDADKGSLE